MRLRQVALIAHELESVVEDICAVFDLEIGYRDPAIKGFGLHNAVLPVGDSFLEIVSPIEAGTTAGRLLERRGGDGGYMVIVQTDDLAADRARVDALGVRVVFEVNTPGARGIHLHPRDVGGAILSLDEMDPAEGWPYAGPDWKSHVRSGRTRAIVGAEVQANDPRAMAERWAAAFGRPVVRDCEIDLARGTAIRFVPAADGRGEGVSGIDVSVRDPETVLLAARARGLESSDDEIRVCGTRIGLRR